MSTWNTGVSLPAAPEEFFYPVVSPKGFDPLVLTILGDTFFGAYTHWDGFPLVCTCEHGTCYGCARNLPRRWNGYIACALAASGKRVIGQLTEGAARQLLPVLQKRRLLRGITCELRRKNGKKNNAPVVVKILADVEPRKVMEEHPIHPSLTRLWGLNLERSMKGGKTLPPEPASVALPEVDFDHTTEDDGPPPTPEQMQRLRAIIGGIGETPF